MFSWATLWNEWSQLRFIDQDSAHRVIDLTLACKMVDIADVNVGRAHHLTLNSDKNNIDICVNCIQLESQLDDALLQLKSLQKVIDLLQQDSEQNEALMKVNFQGILDKNVNVKHVEVGNASMNNST